MKAQVNTIYYIPVIFRVKISLKRKCTKSTTRKMDYKKEGDILGN